MQQALRQVVGAYAIAVIEKGNRDEIIAARQSSPMAIGIGEGEFFLSSDAASVIEYTQDFVYVNDGEIAVINRHKPLKIVTLDNHEGRVDIKKLQMSISQLEKGGYPHFMLKEIYEQPKTIVDCIRGRISPDTYEVKLSGRDRQPREIPRGPPASVFVACGTSWHAALIGEHLIENICRIPVEVEYASEFRYRNPIINADDIVIAVSQSARRPTRWPPWSWPARPGHSSSASATSWDRPSPGDRLGGIHPMWGPRSAWLRPRPSRGR